jgi:hypothetical protein
MRHAVEGHRIKQDGGALGGGRSFGRPRQTAAGHAEGQGEDQRGYRDGDPPVMAHGVLLDGEQKSGCTTPGRTDVLVGLLIRREDVMCGVSRSTLHIPTVYPEGN